ncbi:MAG: hypothetical protein HY245_01550 [Rhizobiales bacterium]|nr:hypothetical protein [Hyphomicrobiales bacterium]MBI3672113.1 hypothetical protein [Hyphomicrobiales bacterium]
MLIHGFPITARLPDDFGIGERFWYWRGASGRSYIHSIYRADLCPPLPGAVYVAVKREASGRRALACGRFPGSWDGTLEGLAGSVLKGLAADEIHVHLLAGNDLAAEAVWRDLAAVLDEERPAVRPAEPLTGFREAVQLSLLPA